MKRTMALVLAAVVSTGCGVGTMSEGDGVGEPDEVLDEVTGKEFDKLTPQFFNSGGCAYWMFGPLVDANGTYVRGAIMVSKVTCPAATLAKIEIREHGTTGYYYYQYTPDAAQRLVYTTRAITYNAAKTYDVRATVYAKNSLGITYTLASHETLGATAVARKSTTESEMAFFNRCVATCCHPSESACCDSASASSYRPPAGTAYLEYTPGKTKQYLVRPYLRTCGDTTYVCVGAKQDEGSGLSISVISPDRSNVCQGSVSHTEKSSTWRWGESCAYLSYGPNSTDQWRYNIVYGDGYSYWDLVSLKNMKTTTRGCKMWFE